MKKLIYTLLVLIAVGAIIFGHYFHQYQNFIKNPVFSQTTSFEVEKGQNFTDFYSMILNQNANGETWQWRLFAKLEPVGAWLTVGEFTINAELTPMQMMQKIKNNQVVNYQFTIIEGSNWRELKQKLSQNQVLKQTISKMNDAELLKMLGANETSLEGLFLPETYQFVKGDSDVDILKRAHASLNHFLQKSWQNKTQSLPYKSQYEMLTMASIVEKETAQVDERAKIAGVFVRRLLRDMKLQTDPTVIYGLGEAYDGDIKRKDLKTDTPYNTYTRKGLPPTPIAMASAAAIAASAHPEEGRFLYFVANNRGGHYFSETYEEHRKAVQSYLKGHKL